MPAHPASRRERGLEVTKRGFAPLKLPLSKRKMYYIILTSFPAEMLGYTQNDKDFISIQMRSPHS
jgi:hypothetical protein